MQARNLTLTEELEKLEQSITLTLQEIDHNFSRAHRIVTGSILPIVEQYAKHSEAVWEGSKFWKQFFEASANVSLSGYEEPNNNPDEDDTTQRSETFDESPSRDDDLTTRSGADHPTRFDDSDDDDNAGRPDDSILSSPSISAAHAQSTPRQPSARPTSGGFANFGSPYEALKREMRGEEEAGDTTLSADEDDDLPDHTTATAATGMRGEEEEGEPATPGRAAAALPDMSMTPESSPFAPGSASTTTHNRQHDPLLHRMLDRTYRIAATPRTGRSARIQTSRFPAHNNNNNNNTNNAAAGTPGNDNAARARARRTLAALDSSPLSSPGAEAPPQLRADMFSSPLMPARTPGRRTPARKTPRRAPRPGESVLHTPGAAASNSNAHQQGQHHGSSTTTTAAGGGKGLDFTSAAAGAGVPDEDLVTWDSDEEATMLSTAHHDGFDDDGYDDFAGEMSPPKTLQFSVPQSRLLRTPAREASRRIVEDLLATAGGGDDSLEGEGGAGEASPSVVRPAAGGWVGEDESF
ncbi:uncharacterized protein K452DRAFT_322166 [Aplosporella prunicola CBS 121167]|uniref:DASH complex subunit ASK1 n=1 Tax=Aplosporella prunicola CBS 121167 TaxID=1176127 RepID=A0A6A6B271_9PEZI|nr:uncharacterized protein K452DRAFT_322166 [Aplosporella prunicola CBS 121167]KAF2136831.1 hypothetical protein K452DRAFT_322166 [Aplosporella prunicola CBS 121167]